MFVLDLVHDRPYAGVGRGASVGYVSNNLAELEEPVVVGFREGHVVVKRYVQITILIASNRPVKNPAKYFLSPASIYSGCLNRVDERGRAGLSPADGILCTRPVFIIVAPTDETGFLR